MDKSPNSRETARRSAVLAMGTSLQIGIAVFKKPYQFLSATPGLQRYDLSGKDSHRNELKIEARGRIDGTNVKRAITQVHKKFAKGGLFESHRRHRIPAHETRWKGGHRRG